MSRIMEYYFFILNTRFFRQNSANLFMKTIQNWKLNLRDWQGQAFLKLLNQYREGSKDFLCVATPGAGKTLFALRIAHFLLSRRLVDRVIVLCPTEHLKRQWASAAFESGISLDPFFENSRGIESSDYFGATLTYAQVGVAPEVHARNTNGRRTFVIFDEIHHLGDMLTWGDAIRLAFSNASYRLAISGTPFRGDANPIPFVKYIEGQSFADFRYGYKDALHDRVCRPVYFPAFEGQMEWRIKDRVYRSSFKTQLNQIESSARLKTALDPKGKWLDTVIHDAHKKLEGIRNNEQPGAAGLLIATDQTHARGCARLLEKITGVKPVIVLSDEKNASEKIASFRDSNQEWIIAVKMVSEGVDIPRLRVGVYATNVKSELFFRQAVGRFVRVQRDVQGRQHSYFYIPKDIDLVGIAKKIETERDHYINEASLKDPDEGKDPYKRKPSVPGENFESISSMATSRIQYELDFGEEFKPPEEKQKRNKEIPVALPEREIPVFEKIQSLKDDINDLSRRVAMKKANGQGRIDWELPHRMWLSRGGKSIDRETMEELKARKTWLLGQLY